MTPAETVAFLEERRTAAGEDVILTGQYTAAIAAVSTLADANEMLAEENEAIQEEFVPGIGLTPGIVKMIRRWQEKARAAAAATLVAEQALAECEEAAGP